jgi:hypothetical protein
MLGRGRRLPSIDIFRAQLIAATLPYFRHDGIHYARIRMSTLQNNTGAFGTPFHILDRLTSIQNIP